MTNSFGHTPTFVIIDAQPVLDLQSNLRSHNASISLQTAQSLILENYKIAIDSAISGPPGNDFFSPSAENPIYIANLLGSPDGLSNFGVEHPLSEEINYFGGRLSLAKGLVAPEIEPCTPVKFTFDTLPPGMNQPANCNGENTQSSQLAPPRAEIKFQIRDKVLSEVLIFKQALSQTLSPPSLPSIRPHSPVIAPEILEVVGLYSDAIFTYQKYGIHPDLLDTLPPTPLFP